VTFRDRLLRSLVRLQPVLDVPGVLVGGSQVPNLLEPDAAATLVVSQDIDLVVPVNSHKQVKDALAGVTGYEPSREEPSVWLPDDPGMLEINLIGRDAALRETADSYVLDDSKLPLLVFGLLSLLREGVTVEAGGARIPLPRPAGLLVEKLLTERAGLKGERDLLVAVGLLMQCGESDLAEISGHYLELLGDMKSTLLGNLAILSLMRPLPEMPDPIRGRQQVEALLTRLKGMPG
jgi:hypothetical protein